MVNNVPSRQHAVGYNGKQIPLSVEEALVRSAHLLSEIERLKALSMQKIMIDGKTGRRYTPVQQEVQRRLIATEIRSAVNELKNLKKRFTALTAQDKSPVQGKVTDINASNLLTEARHLASLGDTDSVELGCVIALATRYPLDLAQLDMAWEHLSHGNARGMSNSKPAGAMYVKTLLEFERWEDALRVTRNLDSSSSDVAYAWLWLATYMQDPNMVQKCRDLGDHLSSEKKPQFFWKMYEQLGDEQDAERALSAQAAVADRRKYNRLVVALVKAHLSWGKLEQARTLTKSLDDTGARLQALAFVADFSEEEADFEAVTAWAMRHPPTRAQTIQTLVTVLAENNLGSTAIKILNGIQAEYLRCLGFSLLASFLASGGAVALARAEKEFSQATLDGSSEHEMTRLALVLAQATHGHMARAYATTEQIRDKTLRCMALLLMSAKLRNEDAPECILEVLR